jgi:uncharacterized protein YndB with AHSA1/START domain
MPQVIERQITINAPAEKVFSYLADFPRHTEWAANPLRIEQTSSGPVGVGTTFASVGHQLGRDWKDKLTVTEVVLNEKIVFESDGKAGRFRHYFLLQEEGEGTRLTKGTETLHMPFPFNLLAPIGNIMTPRQFDSDLRRIKAKLEGEATA